MKLKQGEYMKRSELTQYLNTYLRIDDFKDYSSNGLQVEGKDEINKIVTGVSANVELFEKAIELKADAIIVPGVSISDPDKIAGQRQWKKELFEQIEEMGANIFRIPVHLIAWRGRTLTAYLELLD